MVPSPSSSSSSLPQEPTATFLFCHGAGLCKDIWNPIIARLECSPLLQQLHAAGGRIEFVTFDLPYHGANRDVSQPATLHLENPQSPRVSHPAMLWPAWSTAAVQRQVTQIRAASTAPLIGIGHSMGAAALWAVEAESPGSFHGLILFEPTCILTKFPRQEKAIDFLVSLVLRRRAEWDSLEEAEAEIHSMRQFARWHPESLRAYTRGAVVPVDLSTSATDAPSKVVLACHPHIEASFNCGELMRLSADQAARVLCPISFQYGERTMFFFPEFRQPLVDKFPQVYSIAEPVPKTTHALVMEDPDTVSSRITDVLAMLPVFASHSSPESSRL